MGHYLLKDAPKTGTGDLIISVQAVNPVRIPKQYDSSLFDRLLSNSFNKEDESALNDAVFNLYGLNTAERKFIDAR